MQYIKSSDEFVLLPGSIDAIARLTSAGYRVAVATNQSGISRGFYDESQLSAIHDKMQSLVKLAGGAIDRIEYCPHMPDSGCVCRKPNPGLLQRIANAYGCSLSDVPFVGDRISDIEAAEAAGAMPVMVLSFMTDRAGLAAFPHGPVFHSLADYVDALLMKSTD